MARATTATARVAPAVTLATATAVPAAMTATKNAVRTAVKSRATASADVLAAATAAAAELMNAVCPGLGLVVMEAKKGLAHGSYASVSVPVQSAAVVVAARAAAGAAVAQGDYPTRRRPYSPPQPMRSLPSQKSRIFSSHHSCRLSKLDCNSIRIRVSPYQNGPAACANSRSSR